LRYLRSCTNCGRKLPEGSLEALVEALLNEIPEDCNGSLVLVTVNSDTVPSSPSNGQKANTGPIYDPAMVYILEFCTTLALRDEKTIELLGQRVVGVLQAVLRDVGNYHPTLVARATFYLFRLLQAGYDHDYVRVPVLLHNVSSFSRDLLQKTSAPVLQGLKLCIDKPGPLRNEIMTSPDFWVILQTLSSHSGSAATVFEILESGVSGSPPAIMADNYEAAVKLLNSFASAASSAVISEPKADRRGTPQRKPRPSKPEKAPNEKPAVARGVKAVNILYTMTSRIPHLMNQSHLESNEGTGFPIIHTYFLSSL
jgi:brefeldin A-resistance guanine nucleotide exchange factor 1